ncbi:MAG: hypothetical protein H0U81_09040 [Pyrinomonadaceae bacterium]|nr:hypothetical protein [Pyrinomonadaceae bacterium]
MKKLMVALMSLMLLAATVVPATAKSRQRRYARDNRTSYSSRYDQSDRVYNDGYYRRNDRSVWQKHRDKITVAAGTGAGAVIGGLIGGKKGAVIGAITGGAGSAVYTYKVRKDRRQY